MKEREAVSEKKLAKLAKHVSKAFCITDEEAYGIIYDEWELVESLYAAHKKTKVVKKHFLMTINILYRIA